MARKLVLQKGQSRLRFGVIAAMLIAVLVLAACGGGSSPTPTAVPPLPTEVPAEPTVAPAEPTAAPAEPTEAPAEVATEAPEEAAVEAEEVAASEEMTETAEVAATEEVTETEEVAASEEMTETEEVVAEATEAPTEEANEEASEEAASASAPTIDSARRVAEILSDDNAFFSVLAPDGSQIAYYVQSGRRNSLVQQICTFTFANATKNCHDLPAGEFAGFPYQLQWSPDASTIAFTENPVELGNDADIWTLAVADGVFANLTDDGATGSWQSALNNSTDDLFIDYMPAWSPDGEIYFWRVVPQGGLSFNVAIYKVSPDGGDAEEVRNISEEIPNHLIHFRNDALFLDGYSAVSPDGSSLATILTTVNAMGAQQPVVYVFDLEDADTEAQLLISADQWSAAIPAWQTFPPAPLGLAWSGDGAGVVVFAFSNAVHTPFSAIYYADVASGDVTPIVDFSAVESASEYLTGSTDAGLPMRAFSPWSASLSPSGDALLLVNNLGGTTGVFWAPLPPTGELPTVIGSQDTFITSQATRSSRASNGLVLVYGILFTISE